MQPTNIPLRDYLAAHAPANPQPWFLPIMPPKPDVPYWMCEKGELRAELQRYLQDGVSLESLSEEAADWITIHKAASDALTAWNREREKQCYIQWPYAWADEQLKARGTDTALAAARYQWLRAQTWDASELCVVTRPKQSVKLGHDCPFGERLDAAIDEAMARGEQA